MTPSANVAADRPARSPRPHFSTQISILGAWGVVVVCGEDLVLHAAFAKAGAHRFHHRGGSAEVIRLGHVIAYADEYGDRRVDRLPHELRRPRRAGRPRRHDRQHPTPNVTHGERGYWNFGSEFNRSQQLGRDAYDLDGNVFEARYYAD
jgi:hypothetical protein